MSAPTIDATELLATLDFTPDEPCQVIETESGETCTASAEWRVVINCTGCRRGWEPVLICDPHWVRFRADPYVECGCCQSWVRAAISSAHRITKGSR